MDAEAYISSTEPHTQTHTNINTNPSFHWFSQTLHQNIAPHNWKKKFLPYSFESFLVEGCSLSVRPLSIFPIYIFIHTYILNKYIIYYIVYIYRFMFLDIKLRKMNIHTHTDKMRSYILCQATPRIELFDSHLLVYMIHVWQINVHIYT